MAQAVPKRHIRGAGAAPTDGTAASPEIREKIDVDINAPPITIWAPSNGATAGRGHSRHTGFSNPDAYVRDTEADIRRREIEAAFMEVSLSLTESSVGIMRLEVSTSR